MKVADLKALAKERELRGFSKLKKADLIIFLQNNLQPMRTRPPHPTRLPPKPPSQASPLVRFRPDRPRQPELLRKLEERDPQPVRPT